MWWCRPREAATRPACLSNEVLRPVRRSGPGSMSYESWFLRKRGCCPPAVPQTADSVRECAGPGGAVPPDSRIRQGTIWGPYRTWLISNGCAPYVMGTLTHKAGVKFLKGFDRSMPARQSGMDRFATNCWNSSGRNTVRTGG